MKETENIESYLARGQYLRDQLTQCNSAIENEEYIGLVLNGLPTTYSGIRMHMKATGLEKITLEEFRNDLKAQEDELKVVEIGSKLENACISRAKGSGKPEKEPYYRNQKPKNIVTCWVCNKKGHYAKYCWHRPGKKLERDESQKQKQENDGEKVNSANESIRSHESAMNVTKKSDDIDCARWYLDSENQTDKKIKRIWSDNGKEFINREFKTFLQENGIIHEETAPYTPQENGIAERNNRTIIQMTRCMLNDAKLPLRFWAEAAYSWCLH